MIYELQVKFRPYEFASYFYFATSLSKLESVRLQIKQDLLDSLAIATYHEIILKTFECRVKVDFKVIGLQLLYLYNLVYGFTDIKLGAIFSEFALLQLGVIKKAVY